MLDKFINKLDNFLLIIIKAIVFLLPLFFLPLTSEYFEFNKQFLLWIFASVGVLLWLIKIAIEARAKIKINPLNLPVLIFLVLTAAASVFSLDRFSSFFGHFGGFSDAWLGLFSLAIFYFLIINTEVASSVEKIVGLLKLLLISSFIVAVASLAAMFGWLSALSGNQASIFSSASFNLAGGSLSVLAVFLSLVSVLAAGFLFHGLSVRQSVGFKKSDRIFYGACLAVFLMVLALINFSLSWALVFFGAGLMIFFRSLSTGFNLKKILNFYLLIPVGLIIMAGLMLALPNLDLAKMISAKELPKEAALSYDQSWNIAKEALKKNPALGSGPGTFTEDFSLYRPAELNQSPFWQIRFDNSRSRFLEILTTAGSLGGLSYFLIICLVIYLNVVLIKKYLTSRSAASAGEPADEKYDLITLLFTVFILLFFSQIFFFTNTVLNFIFWFDLGLIMAFWQRGGEPLFKEKIIDLNKTKLLRGLSLLVLLIVSVGIFALAVFEIRFFAADIIASRGTGHEINLVSAIKLNPYRANYRISLAELYLNSARAEALKPAGQIDNLKIQTDITRAIETAKAALALTPNSVLLLETLGMIYRDVGPLTTGGEPWAVKYFSGAFNLEPTNPILAAELAKAYLNNNDSLKAEEYFKKALGLKSDYSEAKFNLAKTYLKNKQDNQALVLLNDLARTAGTPEVYYELGRYYYNHGEIDKAIDRFKLVLSLSPKHANSLYSLAVAYETKGDSVEALNYYKQVLELNLGNVEVEKKIKELSKSPQIYELATNITNKYNANTAN